MAGGAAAILLGILTLTIQYTMASTHTWNGVNYAKAFNAFLTAASIGLPALGATLIAIVYMNRREIVDRYTTAFVGSRNAD